jgi:hypothetical protein
MESEEIEWKLRDRENREGEEKEKGGRGGEGMMNGRKINNSVKIKSQIEGEGSSETTKSSTEIPNLKSELRGEVGIMVS